MSNGVGVIVANDLGKSGSIEEAKGTPSIFSFFNAPMTLSPSAVRSNTRLTVGQIDQNRKSTMQPPMPKINTSENKTLINSSIVTLMNHQLQTPSHHHHLKHNYIIKTCLTTYTYLTTFMHNKRSSVSTYETVISVISTESLKNFIDVTSTVKITPTRTKYLEIKTSKPTQDNLQTKIEKRVDNENETTHELIQPSEVSPVSCSLANCPCPLSKTESLSDNKHKTKYNENMNKYEQTVPVQLKRSPLKTNKYGAGIIDSQPTPVQDFDKNTRYGPYKYDGDNTPSDKMVEKYTEVINESPEESEDSLGELLTNEQGPEEKETVSKVTETKKPEKVKDKPQKVIKNKFPVADLLKLGTLGIKSLSQLAPVFEKMTGDFIKRHEETKLATTTVKPVTKLTPYVVDKRIDSEKKTNNFPIYIPVDDIETSESQVSYHNTTLHQNLAWAADHHKHPKAHIGHLKSVHESALVNGGIPISPGEIITANSDVIVGKPAVGSGPLNHMNRPALNHNIPPPELIDSYAEGNAHYDFRENPPRSQLYNSNKRVPFRNDDDSYDLRPPFMEASKSRPPQMEGSYQRNPYLKPRPTANNRPPHLNSPPPMNNRGQAHIRQESPPQYSNPMMTSNDRIPNHMGGPIHTSSSILDNHGRPALLDYIPSLGNQNNHNNRKHHEDFDKKLNLSNGGNSHNDNEHVSSEPIQETIVSSQIFDKEAHKPFLVDIQPSKVANVLIPHGSSTALIFAGSSEPHKTGDYVDDPLPYQEPGYFGSFSIDAPQMTMVHNVAPTSLSNDNYNMNKHQRPDFSHTKPINRPSIKFPQDQTWNSNNKRPVLQSVDFSNLPPPTSNQETYMEIGPHIAAYDPERFNPSSFDSDKKNPRNNGLNQNSFKDTPIDREYENHLAVPPPPLSNLQGNQEQKPSTHGSKFSGLSYNQHPVIYTKPIQDMKVFVNIEHPVPKPTKHQNDLENPSKVTSEIYFASPTPQNQDRVKPFTVHLPSSTKPVYSNQNPQEHYFAHVNTNQRNYSQSYNNEVTPQHNSGSQAIDVQHNTGVNFNYKPDNQNIVFEQAHTAVSQTHFNVPGEGGSIVLNTGANVGELHNSGQKVVGTGITIPGQENTVVKNMESTGIPIGTNVAIKVEGGSNNYGQNSQTPAHFYDGNQDNPEIIIGGNNWQAGSIADTFHGSQDSYNFPEVRKNDTVALSHVENDKINNVVPQKVINFNTVPPSVSFMNSHANFPMTKDDVSTPIIQPASHEVKNYPKTEYNVPPKRIPNFIKDQVSNQNVYENKPASGTIIDYPIINTGNKKIKIESTTHNIIPLSYQHEINNNASNKIKFGQKLPTVGLPPTKFVWNEHGKPATNVHNNLQFKPDKNTINEYMAPPPLTTPSYNPSYIPNYESDRQPAYDIPIREDSSDFKPPQPTHNSNEVKPVYENYDEVYDGENEAEDFDGEVSEESMKVPVITTTKNVTLDDNVSDSTGTSKRKVVVNDSVNIYKPLSEPVRPPSSDTQTEKPFSQDIFNPAPPQSDLNKESTENTFLLGTGQMHPRPFEISENSKPQLQSPGHWTSNQVNINTSPDVKDENANLVLNTGEEVIGPITRKPITFTTGTPVYTSTVESLKIKHRPVFSLKYNNTNRNNESKIITSTINLTAQNPLTVFNSSSVEEPDYSYSVEDMDTGNNSVTEIVNLSPPPPTLDYNFKPSTNEETIMGMSPPPPRTASRIPPMRTLPPRTAPPRTPPPNTVPSRTPAPRTKPPKMPQRTLPPRLSSNNSNKNEISTYRPTYDIIKNKPFQRPAFNREPKPSTSFIAPSTIDNSIIFSEPSATKVIFPTPIMISSGWMTSSGIEFPALAVPEQPVMPVEENLSESVAHIDQDTPMSNIPLDPSITVIPLKETSPVSIINSAPIDIPTKVIVAQSSQITKVEIKPSNIRPDSVLAIPEIYPTSTFAKPINKYSTIRIPPSVYRPTLIEGSETVSIRDEVSAKPTEILQSDKVTKYDNGASNTEKTATVIIKPRPSNQFNRPSARPISDKEVIKNSPGSITTKTEIKTEAVTLTKTLSEPPSTVSTTRFVTLTHTLTVTQIETSLLTPLPGSTTQTLILTNTQTSTVVDVVTEIHTQVQPTTIVETVTKHIPVVTSYEVHPTRLENVAKTKIPALDDISLSSEEDNFVIQTLITNTTEKNVQKLDKEEDNDTFFVVMNKSQNGGSSTPVRVDMEPEFNAPTRGEESGHDGVSHVLLGEILLAGTPYLESTNVAAPTGPGYGKDCQPDCKASRNERCQRMDGIMKCVCRPGFARMFPDRPCKPTYTYSMKLALSRYGKDKLSYQDNLAQPSSKEFQNLALATHEGINRMVMQSDLRDVYHGVHVNGFEPVTIPKSDEDPKYTGVINDFYVQLSDNAHETRLKEVIEKYLRTNNYSLGGTDVYAASELVDKLDVSDYNECLSAHFHDCSEHAECFNLRGTYTCSCKEGFADLSVNPLYPGRICSAEPVGCERCNYHGACYTRDDDRVICECFQWYAGDACQVNLKVILISLATLGAILLVLLVLCVCVACARRRPSHDAVPPAPLAACIQGLPTIHQGGAPSKRRGAHDRRALIAERTGGNDSGGESGSVHNASLPYIPAKKMSQASHTSHKSGRKSSVQSDEGGDGRRLTLMIPRARYHPAHPTSPLQGDIRESNGRKNSSEMSNEAKLISYLDGGPGSNDEMMRRKHSSESGYSMHKMHQAHSKHPTGALISAGFKVSTTIKPDLESIIKEGSNDDASSIDKPEYLDTTDMSHFDTLRHTYSQDDMTEWTDAERRIGELTMSEARSFDGTLVKPPTKLVSRSTCGSNKSSARYTQHEANTMAERDLGSTFLLPHVHLYKPDLGSDMSEFDSL